MRNLFLTAFILFLTTLNSFGQNIQEIEIINVSKSQFNQCYSNCEECGTVVFTTNIPDLLFGSNMDHIKEVKVEREETRDGKKYIYSIVTMARKTQIIIIKGPGLADFKLIIEKLKPGTCQEFIINKKVAQKITSFYLHSIPPGATITIEGEPKFQKVTPFLIKDHPPGTFNIKLEKDGYNPIEENIKIIENEISTSTISLIPIGQNIQETIVSPPITLFYLNSIPQGATIIIVGEPKFQEVTPFLIKDHPSGTAPPAQ